MPNIVHNSLSIQFNDEKELKDFEKRINASQSAGDETFNSLAYSLFPPPKDVEDEYTWTIQNYGGKWGDWYTSTKHMYRSNKAIYVFDSAWAPLINLAEKINELFSNKEFQEKLISNGYETIERNFDIKITVKKYIKLINQVINAK